MSNQQIIRNVSEVRAAVRNQRNREVATDFTESFRPHGSYEPQLEELAPEPQPESGKADRLDWELVELWFFVLVSFAALFFAGYVIWAKCNGG
jgi:hypothetical protein